MVCRGKRTDRDTIGSPTSIVTGAPRSHSARMASSLADCDDRHRLGRQDWPLWMLHEVRKGGFVLVVATPADRKRAEDVCTDIAPLAAYTSGMTSTPFTDARNRLSELIDEVARTHERITITRHGHAAAVLIAPDDLAALEETLEVISRPEVMSQLAESRRAIEAGDVLDAGELAALMAKRTRRAG